jgi:hypothetical protein
MEKYHEIKIMKNVCPLCPEHDAVLIYIKDGEIVAINGDAG